jgi:hypothetical protein
MKRALVLAVLAGLYLSAVGCGNGTPAPTPAGGQQVGGPKGKDNPPVPPPPKGVD